MRWALHLITLLLLGASTPQLHPHSAPHAHWFLAATSLLGSFATELHRYHVDRFTFRRFLGGRSARKVRFMQDEISTLAAKLGGFLAKPLSLTAAEQPTVNAAIESALRVALLLTEKLLAKKFPKAAPIAQSIINEFLVTAAAPTPGA